jgi:hypothetical protein
MAKGQKKREQICAKRRGSQQQQQMALARWAFLCSTHHALDHLPASAADWIPAASSSNAAKPFLVDLHTHSTRSDGMLSPLQLVQRAASSGVSLSSPSLSLLFIALLLYFCDVRVLRWHMCIV